MASGNDMKAHKETYDGFVAVTKWGTIGCVLLTALVVYLIA